MSSTCGTSLRGAVTTRSVTRWALVVFVATVLFSGSVGVIYGSDDGGVAGQADDPVVEVGVDRHGIRVGAGRGDLDGGGPTVGGLDAVAGAEVLDGLAGGHRGVLFVVDRVRCVPGLGLQT